MGRINTKNLKERRINNLPNIFITVKYKNEFEIIIKLKHEGPI